MRVHCLLHAEHEDTGCIEPWLLARGHHVSRTRAWTRDPLPQPRDFDWLIVMGGPMNVYEYERYPWLRFEKALIFDAIDVGRKVLGVCLGAQLIADVLGGKVSRNAEPEIGWFDVYARPAGSRFFAGFPEAFPAFHWHGDTFSIPRNAQLLMASDACARQAFEYGDHVCAIQFHLEVTAANARQWLALETPPAARFVQAAPEILGNIDRFAASNQLMFRLLEAMAAN